MSINPNNIIKLIKENFPNFEESAITDAEHRLADLFVSQIQRGSTSEAYEERALSFYECDPYEDDEETSEDEDEDVPDELELLQDPDYMEEEESPKKKRRSIPDEEIEKALQFYRSAKNGSRSVNVMHKRYRWIKSRADIDNLLLRYFCCKKFSKFCV